jgi:phytoene synthase
MDDLHSLVRRVDEDRWLASRFAPADARARLIALYAVNYEIARTAEVVREAALGDIRLEWWRSALMEMETGAPARDHPALRALAGAYPAAATRLSAVAEARRADFDAQPFAGWSDLERYVDATAGELTRLAIEACAPTPPERALELGKLAARAWAYTGLLRAAPLWHARGRSALPREGGDRDGLTERAGAALAAARRLGAAPGGVFPAIGYAALVPAYLRALRRGQAEPPLFARQLRLIAAAATGRL